METVRPPSADELGRCAELLATARVEASRHRGGARLVPERAPSGEDLAAWVTDGSRLLLAGLFDGAVVGVGGASIGPGGLGKIEACYVERGAREVGVGAALLRGLLDWLAARACTDIDATALPGDRLTKQLLEAAGFKTRLLILHRPQD